MNSAFNEQILADKLSKLNNTQQCIETLSHWCIFHRQKAEQVVQTWDKQFHNSQKEQKIPFLYLANDIIQNSRRKGNEFVAEFWNVLPAALKDVVENGDDRAKNVVSRLVGIWEERKVFGSRGQGLKDLMLGNDPLPALEPNKKRSRSVRIIKRDSRSIKIKLSVGGTAEKIVSALHNVISERHNEDADLNKCQAAVHRVRKMEKNVDIACNKDGDPQRATLAKELQEQESIIKQCIDKLKSVEANRAALVSQLREALHEQESELESVRTQMQVAQAQIEEAVNMCRRLNDEPPIPSTSSAQTNSIAPASEKPKKTSAAIAAEVADKLAASTHSQQIMTSVLSTFAAEAAKNAGLMSTSNLSNSASGNSSENRLKLEKPMAVSQTSFVSAQSLSNTGAHQPQTVLVHQPSMQSQAAMAQPQYSVFPAPPQQFVQQSGAVLIGVPYTYASLPPPPPPPMQVMNLARPPLTQQQQQPQTMAIMQTPPPPPPPPPMTLQQTMPVNLQTVPMSLQPAPPSYRPLQPPSMAYYQHRSQ
uniref:Regulation of nuclear pre-mRNA domain-containing protein 1B n=1 Tax=Anthurium amnicola TaxID=1678845 RepID=A0A1D1YWH2_9ARAE